MTQFIHPAASAEVIDALGYYEAIDTDLSEKFFACVEDYRKRISADPLPFRIRAHGVRRVKLAPQFNERYLAYLIWNDRVVPLPPRPRQTPTVLLQPPYRRIPKML